MWHHARDYQQNTRQKKRKGYSLHSELDWNLKETVMNNLRRCTYFEVCYQIAWNLCSFTYKSQELKILKFVLTGDPLYMDWHERQREKMIYTKK